MKIKKRLKDFPPNVPRRLFKVLKDNNFNRDKTAKYLQVNGGYLSNLLNKGIEPPNTEIGRTVRKKLFLKVHKEKRRNCIVRNKIEEPYYMKDWKHLSKEERHKTIKAYIDWRKKNEHAAD